MNTDMDLLRVFVQELHDQGAIHKKRGFSLQDATTGLAANHLIEETVELQAEATISEDREGVIDESADVLAVFLHLLILCDVSFDEVVARCMDRLKEAFTFDKDEILTDTPGFTRRNRNDDQELRTVFHEIWTANVGQEGYDKEKWQKLSTKLRDLTGIELT